MGDTVQPTSGSAFQVVVFPDTPTPGHHQGPRRLCMCVHPAVWPLSQANSISGQAGQQFGDLGLVSQVTASGFQSHDDV